jgi:hypothetical protein
VGVPALHLPPLSSADATKKMKMKMKGKWKWSFFFFFFNPRLIVRMEERDDAQATPVVEEPGNESSTTYTTNPSSSTPSASSAAGAAEKGQLKIENFVEEKYAPYLREYTVLIE